jgi:dephospho-CoA kinase
VFHAIVIAPARICTRDHVECPGVFAGKPIIGIVGGIGSGKTFVSRAFADEGCLVINSDEQVKRAYDRDDVKQRLVQWWGPDVLGPAGREVNRSAIARRVFADAAERKRLEALIHPLVAEMRDEAMRGGASDPRVVAFVWDTPLLLEVGLHRHCDAVVFVEASEAERKRRVMETRGWSEADWAGREKSQMALDKKREMANYIVRNTAGADDDVRSQVRETLSRILATGRRDTPVE